MSKEEKQTIIELLKQAYMEADWELVLESVEILQKDEVETDKYQDDEFNDIDF